MDETTLRLECLKLAVGNSGPNPNIIEQARAFLSFVKEAGVTKTVAAPETITVAVADEAPPKQRRSRNAE